MTGQISVSLLFLWFLALLLIVLLILVIVLVIKIRKLSEEVDKFNYAVTVVTTKQAAVTVAKQQQRTAQRPSGTVNLGQGY